MEENKNLRSGAVDTSDILYAEGSNLPLFYNSRYDLGKHLTALEPETSVNTDGHFTLARMNISTKNITPPEINISKPKRNFLFIK